MSRAPAAEGSRHRYSFDDYLLYERDSRLKHEFIDGQILAMAGGTPRHSALASRVGAALESGRRAGCVAFQSDLRVRVLATGRATYPDVSLICGPLERDPADPSGDTVTNPRVIVEVLSRTTEEDDRGDTWRDYQRVPSLQEYVLVSQSPRVEVYRRVEGNRWEYRDATQGVLELDCGARLDLAALYADLPV